MTTMSRELRLNTIRDHVAHMIFRHALALRSAKHVLRPEVRERLLARQEGLMVIK